MCRIREELGWLLHKAVLNAFLFPSAAFDGGKIMDANIRSFVEQQLVLLPKGTELLREFVDEQKWISSDSKMSMPNFKKATKKIERNVEIKSFYMARYPVTEGLYNALMGSDTLDLDRYQLPVSNVSWHDAVTYCNLLSKITGLEECYSWSSEPETVRCNWSANGYRLPTEAEWQNACKAGSTGYRYGELADIAWYDGNSGGKRHEVGAKTPNAWGLYDMLGNVWEWCWDLFDETRYGPYRVFRGGSWSEEARGCGASCRRKSHPSLRIDDLGFRLARSYEPYVCPAANGLRTSENVIC